MSSHQLHRTLAGTYKTAPDLREYEEEAVPFDDVIRRLASKPAQKALAKRKPAKARKRRVTASQ